MARPVKTGLDDFPFDTRQSSAVQILEAQCGAAGFGIYVHLLMAIYGDPTCLGAGIGDGIREFHLNGNNIGPVMADHNPPKENKTK